MVFVRAATTKKVSHRLTFRRYAESGALPHIAIAKNGQLVSRDSECQKREKTGVLRDGRALAPGPNGTWNLCRYGRDWRSGGLARKAETFSTNKY